MSLRLMLRQKNWGDIFLFSCAGLAWHGIVYGTSLLWWAGRPAKNHTSSQMERRRPDLPGYCLFLFSLLRKLTCARDKEYRRGWERVLELR